MFESKMDRIVTKLLPVFYLCILIGFIGAGIWYYNYENSKKLVFLERNVNIGVTEKAGLVIFNTRDIGLTWTSKDENIAIVDDEGNVTAVSVGKTKIIATTLDKKNKATCTVEVFDDSIKIEEDINDYEGNASLDTPSDNTVTATPTPTPNTPTATSTPNVPTTTSNPTISVSGIEISSTSITLKPNDTTQLKASVLPYNATNKNVTWKSSDTKVATVDSNGKVIALKSGTATITVTSKDGNYSKKCTVTVKSSVVNVTNITASKTNVSLTTGGQTKITVTVSPSNATNKNIIWSSSDSSVATVDVTGNITALKAGTATITATSSNSKTASIKVTVTNPKVSVTAISLNKSNLSIDKNETANLTATVSPNNANNKNVIWSTSDDSIATVDQNGKITAKKSGVVKIIATTQDGNKKAECTVNVKGEVENLTVSVSGIEISSTSITLKPNDTTQLKTSVLPYNATNKNVTWKSSDTKIVTVDSNGKIKALKTGKATITVTSKDGNYSKKCTITVKSSVVNVTKIEASKTKVSLKTGETTKVSITVSPSNATNKNIIWSSSDSSIATVDATGNITAIKAGTATITAKSSNSKTATIKVTVTNPKVSVTSISLNKSSISISENKTTTLTATISPGNASDKTVIWSTSDASIATVDQNGKITAKKDGIVKIIATTQDGNKKAECIVNVQKTLGEVTVKAYIYKEYIQGKQLYNGEVTNNAVYLEANTNTTGEYTYIWLKDGNTISGATGSSYTATTKGNYMVRITTTGGAVKSSTSIYLDIVTPKIVETKYATDDIVIADIDASDYGVDNTGKTDVTNAIQHLLDKCYNLGGGTVYLPAGKYLVSGSIIIPHHVTLRGDYQDPDTKNASYGTIILANVPTGTADIIAPNKKLNDTLVAEVEFKSLFVLGASSGAMGLTVYYPNQTDLNNVKAYPSTFYIDDAYYGGVHSQNIINCTVINGYVGVSTTQEVETDAYTYTHGMLYVKNLKGTFLKSAVDIRDHSGEVDIIRDIKVDSKYFSEGAKKIANVTINPHQVNQYTVNHLTGVSLGYLEMPYIQNITVSNANKGVEIDDYRFMGQLYNITVNDSVTGVSMVKLREDMGTAFAKVRINGGSVGFEYTKVNNGIITLPADYKEGYKFFQDVVVPTAQMYSISSSYPTKNTQDITDKRVVDNTSLSSYTTDYNISDYVKVSNKKLFVVYTDISGLTDVSSAIQQKLNEASAAGGGVVYLPTGKYRVSKPLTVPSNVELRGSSSVPTRDTERSGRGVLREWTTVGSNGTIIFATYSTELTKTSLITLSKNSGIRGLRIRYIDNGDYANIKTYPYTIIGKGSNVYAINLSIAGSTHGIDFSGCNNHLIQKVYTACYTNAFKIGNSSNGIIEDSLQNAAALAQDLINYGALGVKDFRSMDVPSSNSEYVNLFTELFEPIYKDKFIYIIDNGTTNQKIVNTFVYGAKNFIHSKNTKNLLMVNIGFDYGNNVLHRSNVIDRAMIKADSGSNTTVINALLSTGCTYQVKNVTNFKVYNRITYNKYTDGTGKQDHGIEFITNDNNPIIINSNSTTQNVTTFNGYYVPEFKKQ